MKLTYYKNLDGVRALAALMVMVFHFFQGAVPTTSLARMLAKLAIFGQTGVTLFFVLSGFLITRILLHTKDDNHYFKNFYIRRTLRIFPLYYFFLIIYYFAYPLLSGSGSATFAQQIYYFVYLQNFAITFKWDAVGPWHYWSLAVEEHFYLFWPMVVFLTNRKSLLYAIIGIIVAAFGLRIFMVHEGYQVFFFTFTRFDSLAIGALLALLELNDYFEQKNALRFLLLLLIILIPTIGIWTIFTGDANNLIQVVKYLLLSSTYFALIGYVLSAGNQNVVNKLFLSRVLIFTGKISYGLYVYHPFAFLLTARFLDTNFMLLNFIIQMAVSYVMATMSYYFMEIKFLKIKNFFEYDRKEVISSN